MKRRIIYLLMAAIGTVGFTGCGPGHGTSGERTTTGTQMGNETTGDRAGNKTATTGTSGTRTATGTTGTTTGNTGQRTSTDGTGTNQTTQTSGHATNAATQARKNFMLNQPTEYSYNNENFRFTPDAKGISITRDMEGSSSPFGIMRSFGNDGYYMVTTTNAMGEEELSVGRFDEQGNFTVYKYDRNGDKVAEHNYRSGSPMNRN